MFRVECAVFRVISKRDNLSKCSCDIYRLARKSIRCLETRALQHCHYINDLTRFRAEWISRSVRQIAGK